MALTENELRLIAEGDARAALLAPFQRILEGWSVELKGKLQKNIVGFKLLASGDLQNEWRIKVLADSERHQVVAEFIFNSYGRLFDMRRVVYSKRVNIDAMEEWIKSKLTQDPNAFYSERAEQMNLSLTDPRVIRDLAWRVAKTKTKLPKRRWYNKTKSASLYDLYPLLQAAMAEATNKSIGTALKL
ncbi:MAG TPA: hypothetical protein VFG10_18925 [Saprospiraceae bacterium]|nr:hypothetical protein [Saprospiraceae bacterium]